jgi:hypothetical protein
LRPEITTLEVLTAAEQNQTQHLVLVSAVPTSSQQPSVFDSISSSDLVTHHIQSPASIGDPAALDAFFDFSSFEYSTGHVHGSGDDWTVFESQFPNDLVGVDESEDFSDGIARRLVEFLRRTDCSR